MAIQQSFCIPFYKTDDLTFDELFREVKAIGYAGVELGNRDMLANYVEVIETAHKYDLVVATMLGHQASDGLNNIENHELVEAKLKESIDIAVQYDIPGLICFSGYRHSGQSDLEGLIACAKGLRRIAGYAEEKQVNLNVELLNSHDHPGYQCDHSDWGVALCEMVGSPRVKLLYDIYHMQVMEGDIIRTIRKYIQHIGHFHTAGNPERRDLDDDQELNYRGICRTIANTGYNLYLGHEFRPKGSTLEALRKAFALCNIP